jgi:predicted permease
VSAFILLLLCPLLGYLFARFHWMPPGSTAALNAWVLRVALPALVLVQIPHVRLDPAMLFPALAPWGVMIGAMVLMPIAARVLGWSRGTTGALVLTCGLGNTAFVGLPMISALVGAEGLPSALIADQLGSFLALSSLGVTTAAIYAGRRPRVREIALRVLRFPPFGALIIAFVARALGGWPDALETVLHQLASTLTPLALFAVGLQFKLGALRDAALPMTVGLLWKLVMAPSVVLGLSFFHGVSGIPVQIAILQAAMAPMITAGILAQDHQLDPLLATLTVSVGIALSFVSVPLWWWLLSQ